MQCLGVHCQYSNFNLPQIEKKNGKKYACSWYSNYYFNDPGNDMVKKQLYIPAKYSHLLCYIFWYENEPLAELLRPVSASRFVPLNVGMPRWHHEQPVYPDLKKNILSNQWHRSILIYASVLKIQWTKQQ